jgi:hypothetical protein
MEWEHSVITMSIHKMMEVLEKLNKEDDLSYQEVQKASYAVKALFNLMNIKEHLDK